MVWVHSPLTDCNVSIWPRGSCVVAGRCSCEARANLTVTETISEHLEQSSWPRNLAFHSSSFRLRGPAQPAAPRGSLNQTASIVLWFCPLQGRKDITVSRSHEQICPAADFAAISTGLASKLPKLDVSNDLCIIVCAGESTSVLTIQIGSPQMMLLSACAQCSATCCPAALLLQKQSQTFR